jgi:hypothetical protein
MAARRLRGVQDVVGVGERSAAGEEVDTANALEAFNRVFPSSTPATTPAPAKREPLLFHNGVAELPEVAPMMQLSPQLALNIQRIVEQAHAAEVARQNASPAPWGDADADNNSTGILYFDDRDAARWSPVSSLSTMDCENVFIVPIIFLMCFPVNCVPWLAHGAARSSNVRARTMRAFEAHLLTICIEMGSVLADRRLVFILKDTLPRTNHPRALVNLSVAKVRAVVTAEVAGRALDVAKEMLGVMCPPGICGTVFVLSKEVDRAMRAAISEREAVTASSAADAAAADTEGEGGEG